MQAAAEEAQQAEEQAGEQQLPNGRKQDAASSSTTGERARTKGEESSGARGGSSSKTDSRSGTHSRRNRQSPDVSSRTVSQARSKGTLSHRRDQSSLSLLGSSSNSSSGCTSSSGAGSDSEPDACLSSAASSGSEAEDARWLPWVRCYLPRAQRAAAGRAGVASAELQGARLLVRRRRERELRRLLQGRQGARSTRVGQLGPEAWDLRGQAGMRQLMLAEARCLAAVSALSVAGPARLGGSLRHVC